MNRTITSEDLGCLETFIDQLDELSRRTGVTLDICGDACLEIFGESTPFCLVRDNDLWALVVPRA